MNTMNRIVNAQSWVHQRRRSGRIMAGDPLNNQTHKLITNSFHSLKAIFRGLKRGEKRREKVTRTCEQTDG